MKGHELQGQVELVLKNGEKLILEYTMNSLVELEKKFGDFKEITKQFKKVSLENIRFLIYAGAIDNHQGITPEYVGRYINTKKFQENVEAVVEAFMLAFPEGDGDYEEDMSEKAKEILKEAQEKN